MATAIIFDLDGTLADSSECVVQSAQQVAQAAGLRTVSDEDIRQRIGEPLGPMLAALFGVSGDQLDGLTRAYSETYVRLTKTLERPFPESIGMLQRLRERGWQLAIATGKSQNGAENATRRMGLAPLFDGIHGILPGTPGKPDPAVLRRALADLGVSPAEAIMVGDTTFDLDMAAALSVPAIGVSWGVHATEVLQGRSPSGLVWNMGELEVALNHRFTGA
jgi:phosphoglycolate phosphatase